jgi:competence protein ComEA
MLGWFKRQIRDHFGFSKTETNGVLWLIVLIVFFLAIPQVIQWYYSSNPPASNQEDIALLDSIVTQLEQQVAASSKTINSIHNPFEVAHKATKKRSQTKQAQLMPAFDINTADTSQLQQIKGIGPKLSTRIVKYRDKLGGFINQAQYPEIYGLDPLVVGRLVEQTYITANFRPQQININTADFKTLVGHPYLSYQQVQRIVRYRENHGKLASIQDLLSLGMLEEATFEKIKSYLKVQN